MTSLISQRHGRSFIQRITLALMLAVVTSEAVTAAPQNADAKNSSQVRKYLDEATTVVGWIDLSKIDLDELAAFIRNHNGHTGDMEQPKAVREALIQLGVTRVYWVSDLAGMAAGPEALIVPSGADKIAAVKLILAAVADRSHGTAVVDGNVILVGNEDAVTALRKERHGVADADFLATIDGLQQPHGIAVKTPVSAMLPFVSVLPGLVDGDGALITKATELLVTLKSIAYSGDLPPTHGKLQISTKSAESAAGLASLVNGLTEKRIGKNAENIRLVVQDNNLIHETLSPETATAAIQSLVELMSPARMQAQRMSKMNSLKQIGLAMHNFHNNYGYLPPQALADDDGKRLLSWRVLILPYIDQYPLYSEFHLDEPWDSAHNKALIAKMPPLYQSQPNGDRAATSKTCFVAPLTENSVFGRPGAGVPIADILDGTSNTLMIIEADADRAVIWTKPDDISIDGNDPLASIIGDTAEGFSACLCDGSARFFSRKIAKDTLNALLTIDGRD